MEGNKDESERCISLAVQYSKQGDNEKALKFLNKAERLYPTQKAKGMIHSLVKYINNILTGTLRNLTLGRSTALIMRSTSISLYRRRDITNRKMKSTFKT